ncbi:MAG: hypothetical protein ACOYLT_07490 [Flavobacterium sp.]|uniref:hypothetical protein n=1 Tax=Flavobacterium sp. TaxID=239 RepID=UPI003BED062F
MRLEEIYKLNEQLTESLKSIQDLKEEKLIALSNIEHWSSHEDLFGNLQQAIMRILIIDSKMLNEENKIIRIIEQLNLEI